MKLKLKNIARGIKLGVATAATGLVLSLGIGCDEMSPETKIVIGKEMMKSDDLVTRLHGEKLYLEGLKGQQIEIVAAGKPETNIYTGTREPKTNVYVGERDRTGIALERAYGDIKRVWEEHNVRKNGRLGMKIHTNFEIKNRKGLPVKLVGYFYQRNLGRGFNISYPIEDRDGLYTTSSGQVSTESMIIRPTYNSSIYNDITMFIPYDQLEVRERGEHNIRFDVILWDISGQSPQKVTEEIQNYFDYIRR